MQHSKTEFLVIQNFIFSQMSSKSTASLFAGLPVGVEVAAQRFPALVVGLVQSLTCFETPLSDSHAEGWLKHESLERKNKLNKLGLH